MISDQNIESEVYNDETDKNISINNLIAFQYKHCSKKQQRLNHEENVITTECLDSVDSKINKSLYYQNKILKSNLSNQGWKLNEDHRLQVKISLLDNQLNLSSDVSITPHAQQEDRSSSFLSINYKPNQQQRLSQGNFDKRRSGSSRKSYFSEKNGNEKNEREKQREKKKNDLEKFTPNLYRFVEEKKINRINYHSQTQQPIDYRLPINLANTKINRKAQIHVTTIMQMHQEPGMMQQIHQASRNLSCMHYEDVQHQSQSSTPKGILKFKSGSSLEVSIKSPSKQSIGSLDSKKVKFLLSQKQANRLLEQERKNKFQESVGSPRKKKISRVKQRQ